MKGKDEVEHNFRVVIKTPKHGEMVLVYCDSVNIAVRITDLLTNCAPLQSEDRFLTQCHMFGEWENLNSFRCNNNHHLSTVQLQYHNLISSLTDITNNNPKEGEK